MALVSMGVDLSQLINALIEGNTEKVVAVAREHLQHGETPDVLLGRIGMIAVHGDSDGHPSITLAAAAMLSRLMPTIPAPLDENASTVERYLPLFVQALLTVIPAVRAGQNAPINYPEPLFPSGLPEGKKVNDLMHDAIYGNDVLLTERLLFGLYGSGADYRTIEVRSYDGIATTFQNAGHPLMFAVRGFQLLDAVEWGDRAPNVIHWLAPHLPLRPDANEPAWVQTVRDFTTNPSHSVASVRSRIAASKDENALALQQLISSDADTAKVCQGVFDALITGGASPRAVGSVIALAAADIMQKINDGDRSMFVRAAHGLLFASAVRQIFQRVQDVEVLTLLFTAAAFVNALQKEVAEAKQQAQELPPATTAVAGGGLIAATQLETLSAQLKAQELAAALTTARRYIKLGHDVRALFATIALASGWTDATADNGHTIQIVQAATEEFLAWPRALAGTNIEGLLQIALRAAAFGKRDEVTTHL